jgi:aminoglycoside 6-adenylyltransferase
MRSEQEMMDLILNFARQDENIRLMVLNGSRANPNAKKDIFQDYDIACFVPDVAPYRRKPELAGKFGEIMILQIPEEMGTPPPENVGRYGYLMQFADGTRIDLSFVPLEDVQATLEKESLTVVLLDKDGLAEGIAPPSEHSYHLKPPTRHQFDDCCNEFWWLNPYVAKGLWRGELIYPKLFLDGYMREELLRMMTWYFGIHTGFSRSPGKVGKNLRDVLGVVLWRQYETTHSDHHPENIWRALFEMGAIFRQVAVEVAEHFGFTYPAREDERVSEFIRRVQQLPPDADQFFPPQG